jgi:hypothetical protein
MDALQPLLNDKTADDLAFTALRGVPGSLFEDDLEALADRLEEPHGGL